MLRIACFLLFPVLAQPGYTLCASDSFLAQAGPEARAEISSATADQPYGAGLLWTLTRDTTTLTLVGTIHVYDPRLEPIRAAIAPSLQKAELLLVEATAEDEQAMQTAFAADPALYLITEGPTLPDLLSPEAWAHVQAAASDRGIPSFLIAKMQPWYVSLTLGIPTCALADLVAGRPGLDKMLMADAQAAGVPVEALEDWQTLITALSSAPQDTQLEALAISVMRRSDQEAVYTDLLDLYFREQTAAVWTLGEIAARDLTDLSPEALAAQLAQTRAMLLDQRNLAWIDVIETAAQAHDQIVVAAGAAHLPGDLGLIALLEAEGWRVSRLPLPPE